MKEDEDNKYIGLVLLPLDAQELKKDCMYIYPDSWVWKGHHMTMRFGARCEQDKHLNKYTMGRLFKVLATHVGTYSEDGIALVKALKIEPGILKVDSAKPHITLCVNEEAGGESHMSNLITEWNEMPPRLMEGQVIEVMR